MRTVSRVLLLCLCLGSTGCSAPTAETGEPDVPGDERLDWWREARFGMFIHWGLYAIPAGRWEDETGHAEWIRETAHIPLERYEEFLSRFDPQRFDADEWARMCAAAGMKYLVITSKHHDGFCLFDSRHTEWDVASTPFRRDILAELSAACARHGVRFCTYHSIMDWHHPDYLPRRSWEERPAEGADYERFERYLHDQVTEIVTRYRPGVLWFDGEWENTWTHERGVELYELCRSLDPALVINNRVDVHRGGMAGFSASDEAVGDFGTPEQEIPATGVPGVDWETCMTMNDHWGFNAADANWKSTETLVRMLIDIASKGGNFLLNVGPRADGTFPDEAVARLAEIGAWMEKHGEAIHGTSASPFEALPWGRCTVKSAGENTTLFLHVFERPADGRLVLPGLGNEPLSAGWLAGPRLALPVHREGTDIVVEVPGTLPDPVASVVTLGIEGEPLVYRAPEIVAESDIFVRPLRIEVASGSPELEIRYTLDGREPTRDSPRYGRPLEISATTEVAARAFHGGRAVSSTARRTFERVEPRPLPRADQGDGKLWCEVYHGDWDELPEFSLLTPVSRQAVAGLGLGSVLEARSERLALRFSGRLDVPRDDVYVFALASDDGSELLVDGERVIDNDGLHGTVEKRGRAALAAGAHEVRVHWFNKTGGAELGLRWAPLGEELVPLEPVAPRW